MPLRTRRTMLGNAAWLAPLGLSVGNDVDPFLCPADSTCATSKPGNGSTDSSPKAGEASFFAEMNGPLLIAQIAACVRLRTRILRRIALTCTFTVASAMAILRATVLLESPWIRQRRMDCCRADSRGV